MSLYCLVVIGECGANVQCPSKNPMRNYFEVLLIPDKTSILINYGSNTNGHNL